MSRVRLAAGSLATLLLVGCASALQDVSPRAPSLSSQTTSRAIDSAGAIDSALTSNSDSESAGSNLIVNGGFESPIVPNGGYQIFSSGQTFPGWSVVGKPGWNVAIVSGTFAQNGFTFPAQSGKQWLDLTGTSNTPTAVAQTVATTTGKHYKLSFYVGNVYDPGGIFGTTSTVLVNVNGKHIFTAKNTGGRGTKKQVWKLFTTSFTAQSSKTKIGFVNADPPHDTENGLDGVKLVAQ